MEKITVLTAVDDLHLNELYYSFQTWRKFSPEFFSSSPYVIMYDPTQVKDTDLRFNMFSGLDLTLVPWYDKNNTYTCQREKMLTSLVVGPEHVKTKWYLKLDTDTLAVETKKWIYDEWFTDDIKLIGNPWGYTKPPDAIEKMDDWGDTIPEISKFPRLELHPQPGSNMVKHSRLTTWVSFCQTEWTKYISSFAKKENGDYKLPVASQDTYLIYIAQRMNYEHKKVRFRFMGWDHIARFHKLKKKCEELLCR
jgi:hypothetical protein